METLENMKVLQIFLLSFILFSPADSLPLIISTSRMIQQMTRPISMMINMMRTMRNHMITLVNSGVRQMSDFSVLTSTRFKDTRSTIQLRFLLYALTFQDLYYMNLTATVFQNIISLNILNLVSQDLHLRMQTLALPCPVKIMCKIFIL